LEPHAAPNVDGVEVNHRPYNAATSRKISSHHPRAELATSPIMGVATVIQSPNCKADCSEPVEEEVEELRKGSAAA